MALGCTTSYDAYIATRGAGSTVLSLPHTELEWNRTVDETSTASVTIGGLADAAGGSCCVGLAAVQPWQHELVINRNGVRAWAGPVTNINYDEDSATVEACDLSGWLDRRRIRHRHNDMEGHIATRVAKRYINDALEPDNTMGMVVQIDSSAKKTYRLVKSKENKICLPEINDIAAHAFDWTCVDRIMHLEGQGISTGITLTDAHFHDIGKVTVTGDKLTSEETVGGIGAGPKGRFLQVRVYLEDPSTYGVHERVFTGRQIRDGDLMSLVANKLVELFRAPLVTFSGGEINPDTFPGSLATLIPGSHFSVSLTTRCRAVSGLYRLVTVTGSADGDGDSITVGLEPAWWASI